MTRTQAIDCLIDQISNHTFHHLYRNARTGPNGQGWIGGLNIYSTNNERLPNPAGHFMWLNASLTRVGAATTPVSRVVVANAILTWGGMRLRFQNTPASQGVLVDVIASSLGGIRVNNAPMNSSMTKVAAIFGFHTPHNTVWDSRVSTALCFRLACIFQANGDTPAHAQTQFPDVGYVDGLSQRVQARTPLVKGYWRNGYGKWDCHFAGAQVLLEIADRLNARRVPRPSPNFGTGTGSWTPWEVNMVLFMDDITHCPSAPLPLSAKNRNPTKRRSLASAASPVTGLCGHQIVNKNYGTHFEPACVQGPQNDADILGLKEGAHGLQGYRILLEFYRIPSSGNCKISARVRREDPSFDKLLEAAEEAGCPPKKGGVDPAEQTCSIFVFPLGKIKKGEEEKAIRQFVCNPNQEYSTFLRLLPKALSAY